MTWIKICGTTNLEDALLAVDAGADALGFVFHEKSPRNINPETARAIVAKLPPQVEKVGVFADDDWERRVSIAQSAGLTAVQLSFGHTNITFCAVLLDTTKLYLALPAMMFVDQQKKLKELLALLKHPSTETQVSSIFLDSGTSQQPGGTGTTFDWEKARPIAATIRRKFSLVVAGGLTPTNVSDAVRILRPWGVDVASGVEGAPGKKDPKKLRAFITAVRNIDSGN